jgi:CheY-like chemotaxis protein
MALRALIVDDNGEFLSTARRLLEGEGFDLVEVASSSDEALRRSEEHDFDVILVDVDLGEESGFDLAERLSLPQERRRPIVLISAYAEEDLAGLIEASPAVGFLSKSRLSAMAIIEVLDHTDPGYTTSPT